MIIGTGLTGPVDSVTEYAFSDLFKQSRPWVSCSPTQWDDKRALDLDPNGWVRSLASNQTACAVIMAGPRPIPPYLTGELPVTYDGEGKIRVDRGNEMFLNILETNPKNYIRNIKIMIPGTNRVFHPAFLKDIAPYRVLRFMDWQFTNHSKQTKWADRPMPLRSTYNGGVPLEVMARLCNDAKADGWFCVPHLADDDYVLRMARLLHEKLSTGRRVYVEYSNELWNNIMGQHRYAADRGKALGAANDYEAALLWNAKRSVEVFHVFQTVFPKSRLVRVLGSQHESKWATERMLSYQDTQYEIDAVAIAPYFGNRYGYEPDATRAKALAVPAFANWIRDDELPRCLKLIAEHRAAIKIPHTELIAYEAGQHLRGDGANGDDPVLNALFDNLNRSEEMYDLYVDYLSGCQANGISLLCHFVNVSNYTKWGRWGAMEYTGQAPTPKYRALREPI